MTIFFIPLYSIPNTHFIISKFNLSKYLFNFPIERIKVLVHPESILHSMVAFNDGSVIAQLSVPDMRGAIGYAFNYPLRCSLPVEKLKLEQISSLNFEKVDSEKFQIGRGV